MHDRAAFKGARALVARIPPIPPRCCTPGPHTIAPPPRPRCLDPFGRSRAPCCRVPAPARRALPIRPVSSPPRPPATADRLTASGPWVSGGISVPKTRQSPHHSFFCVLSLREVRPYPFESVHILSYLSHICSYLFVFEHELAWPYPFCDAIIGTAGCPPVAARHKG